MKLSPPKLASSLLAAISPTGSKTAGDKPLSTFTFHKGHLLAFLVIFGAIGGYILTTSQAATLPNVYIAQAAAGMGDGTSCANAKAVVYFNTAANWGTGSSQVSPGTTVHLCGVITSPLRAYGSGGAGSPITILFESGAKLSEPVCPGRGTGCVDLNNQSYITVDGGTNGVLENTDSGTHLTYKGGGSYGINATNCNNCEVKNLTISNIYVHDGSADFTEVDQTTVRAIDFSGSNFLFHDNIVHDVGWAVTFGGDNMSNDRIYNNEIYNVDHGIVPSYSGTGTTGPLYIYNNHFHDFANWDTTSNAYHHDGIHCFSAPGSAGETINGMYIYNNRFDGDIGGHATAWIFLEGGSGASATPCSNSASTIYIFNNDLTTSTQNWSSNDAISVSFGDELVANNTIAGPDATNNGAGGCFSWTSGSTVYNNAAGGCNQIINGSTTATVDYNAYASCTGSFNCFAIGPSSNWTADFSLYQSRYPTFDVHSVANLSAAVGSNTAGVGKNLTSMCSGDLVALCSDINGNPRPTIGAWDAGAIQSAASVNIWLSTTGNDLTCVRGDQTKPCLTFNKVYSIAQPGDLVSVANGTYFSQPNILKGSQLQAGPAITFQCVTPHSCVVSGGLTLGKAGGGPSVADDSPSYLTFDGIDFKNGGVATRYYSASNPKPSNITIQNSHIWKNDSTLSTDGGPGLGVGADNLLLSNVEIGPICCNSDAIQLSGGLNGSIFSGMTLTGLYVHDVYDTCSAEPASVTSVYPCSGFGIGDGGDPVTYEHIDGIQASGGDNLVLKNSRFYAAGAQSIFFASYNGASFTNVTIENNLVSIRGINDEGGHPVTIGQNCANCYHGTWNVLYNTFQGGAYFGDNGQWDPSATLNVIGNIIGSVSSVTQSGCNLTAFGGGSFTPTYTKNLRHLGACGTDIAGDANYVSGSYPYDLHLASGSNAALDAAQTAPCAVSADFDGNTRPQGAACDAGADEYLSGYTPPPTGGTGTTGGGSTTPPKTKLKGDCNTDGHVSVIDLSILLSHYGTNYAAADFDSNHTVNVIDLSMLLSNYGR